MVARLNQLKNEGQEELAQHPFFKALLTKLGKDNIGMLAGYLSWSILTSVVPIIVGLTAIAGLLLQNSSAQGSVIDHLHAALQGALTRKDIVDIVRASTKHAGLLAIIGFAGTLWGGSNVGGAFSTVFQAVFEVEGRSFIKEKLLDIGMIVVFAILMMVVIAATTAGAILNQLFSGFPIPGVAQFLIGTAVGLLASFLLFAAIYTAFPNIQPRFRWSNVWKGAVVAAVLFQILTFVWPLYANFSHFSRYGAVLVPILVLTAWIYFFSMIAMLGAEIVAVAAIREAKREGRPVGPGPNETVPQHTILRSDSEQQESKDGKSAGGGNLDKETRPVQADNPRDQVRAELRELGARRQSEDSH